MRKFPTTQRTINIKVFSLEVLQSGAPYVHCQTCGLVPFLSFPVLLSLLIYPSLPSHLLHHLCSCNKQDSCSPFHSFAFSSLLILDHISHQAWHPQQACLTDLFESHNGAPVQSDWLRRFFVTHYALPLHSKPSQLTQHCFDLLVKACCKRKCHNLTHALSVACTRYMMTLNYSNII